MGQTSLDLHSCFNTMKSGLIFMLGLIFSAPGFAQKSVTLRGKVVELTGDKTVGVPGVVVSVSGESYDVTGQDGSFKLFAPGGLGQITITIKGSASTMLTPYEGKVNIPPLDEPILIKLCSEKNQKLLEKVALLNSKVKSLQKTQKLNARQVELLHRTMMDTIAYYQTEVEKATVQLDLAKTANLELLEKIAQLEKTNAELEDKLFLALGEKYTAQQKYFELISTGLNNYISRLKDLHQILPYDAVACLTNTPQACNRFYAAIEKYNQARNVINENKDQYLQAAEHYWSGDFVAAELGEVNHFILNTLHQPYLFEKMNATIINPIKERSQGNTNLKVAKKEISAASKALAADLDPLIKQLDQKKNKLYHYLTNSIQ
jgi:hypothetical protein